MFITNGWFARAVTDLAVVFEYFRGLHIWQLAPTAAGQERLLEIPGSPEMFFRLRNFEWIVISFCNQSGDT